MQVSWVAWLSGNSWLSSKSAEKVHRSTNYPWGRKHVCPKLRRSCPMCKRTPPTMGWSCPRLGRTRALAVPTFLLSDLMMHAQLKFSPQHLRPSLNTSRRAEKKLCTRCGKKCDPLDRKQHWESSAYKCVPGRTHRRVSSKSSKTGTKTMTTWMIYTEGM